MLDSFFIWYVLIAVVAVSLAALIVILRSIRPLWFARIFRRRQTTLMRGQLLGGGRYRIGRELGRGMNAVTFQVVDDQFPQLGLVAKVLLTPEDEPRISRDGYIRHIRRFHREVEHLQRLQSSKFVVPLHSTHLNAFTPFFVMKRCDGSLNEEVGRGPLPMQPILDVAIDVCQGLADSHRHQIIHRDLKPANILRYENRWVLADFGMSLLGEKGSMVSVPESIPGTIPYTAPEVMYYESSAIKPSADVFSFGITFKMLLTGTDVWEGPTSRLLQRRIDQATQKEVALFDELIDEMTNLRPEDRPKTIDIVVQKLEKIFLRINNLRAQGSAGKKRFLLEGVERLSQTDDFRI